MQNLSPNGIVRNFDFKKKISKFGHDVYGVLNHEWRFPVIKRTAKPNSFQKNLL